MDSLKHIVGVQAGVADGRLDRNVVGLTFVPAKRYANEVRMSWRGGGRLGVENNPFDFLRGTQDVVESVQIRNQFIIGFPLRGWVRDGAWTETR